MKRDTVFEMEVRTFGEADGSFVLYSDDFESFAYEKEQGKVKLEKHPGEEWKVVQEGETWYLLPYC